jgi:hypothetical protein
MVEGKYLNLPDMKRTLGDLQFIKEKLLPILKVGADKGHEPEQIFAVCLGIALFHWAGELPAAAKPSEESPFSNRVEEPAPGKVPLVQADLNKMTCNCGAPDCDGVLFFHSKCHPKAPSIVSYRKDGLLMINCAVCKSPVCLIAVDRKA